MILPIDWQYHGASRANMERQLMLDLGTPTGAGSGSKATTPAGIGVAVGTTGGVAGTAGTAGGGAGAIKSGSGVPAAGTIPPASTMTTPAPNPMPPAPVGGVAAAIPNPNTAAPRPAAVPSETSTLADSSTSDSNSTNILSQAVANSNLTWWQLICVAVAGTLLVGVGIWAIFRSRRKKREDAERKKEIESLEKAAKEEQGKAADQDAGKKKGKKEEGDESSDWDSEEYDSFSDGGTIRPSRRRGRGRDRRRYRPNRRRGRDRRGRDREYYSSDDESDYSYRPDHNRRDRNRRNNRQSPSPSPSPSPTPDPKKGKRKSFRDSVFSTYQSMKSAAVRLKQAEMSERLKKQLEDEDRIEFVRQAKVKEANEAIARERAWLDLEREKERLKGELEKVRERARVGGDRGKERMGSGDSRQLLIPPSNRTPNSAASSSSTPHSRHTPSRQTSYPLPTPRRLNSTPGPQLPPAAKVRIPPRGNTVDTLYRLPETGLGRDIHNLLGTKPSAGKKSNLTGPGAQQSLPVKATKDRPGIPKGGLAPAPKGKKRPGGETKVGQGLDIPAVGMDHGWPTSKLIAGGAGAGVGSRRSMSGFGSIGAQSNSGGTAGSGGKWADRMRARR